MTRYIGFVTPDTTYSPNSFASEVNLHGPTTLGTDDQTLSGVPRSDSVTFGGCLLEAGGLDVRPDLTDKSLEIGTSQASSIVIGRSGITVSLDSQEVIANRVTANQGVQLGFPVSAPEGTIRYSTGSKTLSFYDGVSWKTLQIGNSFPFVAIATAENAVAVPSTSQSMVNFPTFTNTAASMSNPLFALNKE